MSRSTTVRTFLKDLVTEWNSHNPARLAAALAYYGMFSFAPMLYVVLTVASRFIDVLATTGQLFERLAQNLGPDVAQFIYDMVVNASQRTSSGGTVLSSLISLGVLLYAATGLFAQLRYSLNIIWEVKPDEDGGMVRFMLDYILTRLLAFGLVLGVGLVLILAMFMSVLLSVLTTFLNYSGDVLIANLLTFIALSAVSFAILYKILPDTHVAWRDVWLGALITAIAFAVGRWGLGFYLSHSTIGTAFEAAGALAIVLIAIYYGAQIFLFGAIFTKVYAKNFGSKNLPKTSNS